MDEYLAMLDDLTEQELDNEEEEEESGYSSTDQQINDLEIEIENLKQQLLRAYADLQNFRRQSAQRIEEVRLYANEDFMRVLLPTLDNFERTLAALKNGATLESLEEGVTMVYKNLVSNLTQFELTRIPAVGQHFDPLVHEAITTWESPEFENDTITDELEAGYKLKDRVIRPARVRVVRNG